MQAANVSLHIAYIFCTPYFCYLSEFNFLLIGFDSSEVPMRNFCVGLFLNYAFSIVMSQIATRIRMKVEKIAVLKDKLAQQKAEIEQREKLLRQKERAVKTRRHIEVGVIAAKFGIDELDNETLMGAFADIKEQSSNTEIRNAWKQKGIELSVNRNSPLLVSFAKNPPDEIKAALKEKRFHWNRFCNVWQGYGVREELESLIKDHAGKVDEVKD